MEHHDLHEQPNNNHNIGTILLLITGAFCRVMSRISYDVFKEELFYWLGVISVALIIIINFRKAKEIITADIDAMIVRWHLTENQLQIVKSVFDWRVWASGIVVWGCVKFYFLK